MRKTETFWLPMQSFIQSTRSMLCCWIVAWYCFASISFAEDQAQTQFRTNNSLPTHKLVSESEIPANLPLLASPRNWGDSFLPQSKPSAREISSITLAGLTPDERVALCCLQGLIARQEPSLWLVRTKDDLFWQERHLQKKHFSKIEATKDWTQLFVRHRELFRGAILFDDQLYRGDLLAVNVAACEDLIVATPELAKRLQLPVKIDLRGRFKTYAEGLQWLWENYRNSFNLHLCDFRFPGLLSHATFEYSYQWRAIMFWPAGPMEVDKPGVDRATEYRLVARILSEMPIGGVCLGFPAMNEGEGLGEPPGVELLSRYGKALVCNNHGSNYSLLSSIRLERLNPPHALPGPALEQDKIYIALVMSDGDNQILWPSFFRRYFEHGSYGKFPLAFGMGPAIRELQPGIAQWYYEHAAPNTEFITDVSGAGYIHPESFGVAYQQPERVWTDFLTRTKQLMLPLGHRSIRTVGGSDDTLAHYVEALPFCHSVFADMGRYSGRSGIDKLTYSHTTGMPIFRAVTSWRYGKDGLLKEIREQVGKQRPAFVNGFVHCWTFDMPDLVHIHEQRDADMVFVTPSQLAQLYREASLKQSLK